MELDYGTGGVPLNHCKVDRMLKKCSTHATVFLMLKFNWTIQLVCEYLVIFLSFSSAASHCITHLVLDLRSVLQHENANPAEVTINQFYHSSYFSSVRNKKQYKILAAQIVSKALLRCFCNKN